MRLVHHVKGEEEIYLIVILGQTCDTCLSRLRQEDHEFEANLSYAVSFGSVWTT